MTMKKCGSKTEVYSRVVGYFRPISQWNNGKRSEFNDRDPFRINENRLAKETSDDQELENWKDQISGPGS